MEPWKLHIMKLNLYHENFTNISSHNLHLHFCCYSWKILTSITNLMLTKLGLVRMVGCHYKFLILQYFEVYPNLNEVVFQLTQMWFGLLQFIQIFMTYANLNAPLLLPPDLSNSRLSQVWMKLFQLPKFDRGCWNLPKCFWLYPISMKRLFITQIGMTLFEVAQNLIKLFEVIQFWIEQLLFAKFDLVCSNLPKFFQFMEIFLISHKFELSCSNLLKFDWGFWNLPKWFWFYLNLIRSPCSSIRCF